jgi:NADH-quinone oxidoreductase subunit N
VDTAPINAGTDVRLLMGANGLAMLLFGILPEPLMALCYYSIEYSFR